MGVLFRKVTTCHKSNRIQTWQRLAERYNWEEVRSELLRPIIWMVYTHQHGHILITAILPHIALPRSDIEMISWHWKDHHPDLVQLLTAKLYETGKRDNTPWQELNNIALNLQQKRVPTNSTQFDE